MTDLLLATYAARPHGEGGAELLDAALAERGVDARWAVWDDPSVEWSGPLVAVRSTWDYSLRRGEFLAWARLLPRVLNGAETFAWNTDKSYLLDLQRLGLPVVPSLLVDGESELPAAIAEVSPGEQPYAVVKPRVGAGGTGLVVLDGESGGPLDDADLGEGPWLVQPLVGSIRTEGETSVYVVDGRVVSQALKTPGGDDVRVHPQHGGTYVEVPVDEEAAALARRAVSVTEGHLGRRLDYARVDAMRVEGALVLSEIELTEPSLYLDLLAPNAGAFADLVVARLASS